MVLDPGEGGLLAAGGRDAEGNGGLGPLDDAIDKPCDEDRKGGIREDRRQQKGKGAECNPQGRQGQDQDGDKRYQKVHDAPRWLIAESDDRFFHVGHGIDDQFDQAAVIQTAALLRVIVVDDVPDGAFAVRAGGADIFRDLPGFALEGIEDLQELLAGADQVSPLRKIVSRHDGKTRTAAAAVVLHAMGRHFPESRGDLSEDAPLGLNDPHGPHHVAGIVQGDGKIVPAGIKLQFSAQDDLLQRDHGRFPRDIEISRQQTVGDDGQRFMRMAAFAHDDLFDLQPPGDVGMLDGDA